MRIFETLPILKELIFLGGIEKASELILIAYKFLD